MFVSNRHVARSDDSDVEDEVMRTALNGVLHMGNVSRQQRV